MVKATHLPSGKVSRQHVLDDGSEMPRLLKYLKKWEVDPEEVAETTIVIEQDDRGDYYYLIDGYRLRSRPEVARHFGADVPAQFRGRWTLESYPPSVTRDIFPTADVGRRIERRNRTFHTLVAACAGGGLGCDAVARGCGAVVKAAYESNAAKCRFIEVNFPPGVAQHETLDAENFACALRRYVNSRFPASE